MYASPPRIVTHRVWSLECDPADGGPYFVGYDSGDKTIQIKTPNGRPYTYAARAEQVGPGVSRVFAVRPDQNRYLVITIAGDSSSNTSDMYASPPRIVTHRVWSLECDPANGGPYFVGYDSGDKTIQIKTPNGRPYTYAARAERVGPGVSRVFAIRPDQNRLPRDHDRRRFLVAPGHRPECWRLPGRHGLLPRHQRLGLAGLLATEWGRLFCETANDVAGRSTE